LGAGTSNLGLTIALARLSRGRDLGAIACHNIMEITQLTVYINYEIVVSNPYTIQHFIKYFKALFIFYYKKSEWFNIFFLIALHFLHLSFD